MSEIVRLSDLAEQINAEHEACVTSAKDTVMKAIEVGRLLCQAKAVVDRGRWIPWIESNCRFDRHQAWRYMQAHKNRGLIEDQMLSAGQHFEGLKGALKIIEEAREEREEPSWSKTETARKAAVTSGRSVTADMKEDLRLVEWAQSEGLFVRIDRATDWGNPFLLDEDGDRDEVIEAYSVYLSYKRSLHPRFESLRGKVLGCWCYPEGCHGDVLIREAYSECAPDEARRVGCHG